MARLRLGVVGVGHLGKEHARILAAQPDVELVGVADVNAEQVQTIARRCNTQAYTDYRELLPKVDAVSLAAPTADHHTLARDFLQAGIPVMVEKPLASSYTEAADLVSLSRRHDVLLQVGHIERFNPIFVDLQRRPLQPKFIEAHREGKFTGRSTDIGVVLDLMIHDLDLVLALVRSPVVHVEALGASLVGKHEDMATARLTFENGCVANLTASRVSAEPSRQMRIFAPEGYVCLDFAQRRATLMQPTIHCRRDGLGQRKLDPSMIALLKDNLYGRFLETKEFDLKEGDQLTAELRDFVDSVRTGRQPRVPGEDGLRAIELATRVLEKIHSHAWDGHADGPTGPTQLPAPIGQLFPSAQHIEKAA